MAESRCSSLARSRFSVQKRRAFFQSARRYEVDPSAGADAARNTSTLALWQEAVRVGAMRRRTRRHGRKATPSKVHPCRARFPPARHPSNPLPRKPSPHIDVPPHRRGSPSLPSPLSTGPSRARCRHAPCSQQRYEPSLKGIPGGPSDKIRHREMATAQKDKPRAGVELPGSFARRAQQYSTPLLLYHPDPCLRESQREISLFAPPLLSIGIPEWRGRAERKRIPARV